MKKIIYSFTLLCALSLTAQPSFSYAIDENNAICKDDNGNKKKEIKIVSSRASGDMQLRFTAEKAEKVTIKILNDAGQMVLKQTNDVTVNINNIPLKNALELAEGQYTIHLISGDETYSTSFLIWK
jgi:hypothetical protein